MVTFSHSQIETYFRCQLQYKYKYIEKKKGEKKVSIEQFVGTHLHKVLYKLFLSVKDNQTLAINQLLSYHNKLWHITVSSSLIITDDYTLDEYRELAQTLIEEFYDTYTPFTQLSVCDLETSFTLPISSQDSYWIRIDQLAQDELDRYFVIDYKSTRYPKTKEELLQDQQLGMYALWVSERKRVDSVGITWKFLRSNTQVSAFHTKESLSAIKKRVMQKIQQIKTTADFAPQPSNACNMCAYKKICPAWTKEKIIKQHTLGFFE